MTNQLDAWPSGKVATMDVTYTQANAAGGAIVCEITPGAGSEFMLVAGRMINSGTNACSIVLESAVAGNSIGILGTVASGAGTEARVPSIGTAASSTGNLINSTGLIVSGVQTLKFAQTGAGAQNDTLRVLIDIRHKGPALPTVVHSSSTNPANVSVTAGAESFLDV